MELVHLCRPSGAGVWLAMVWLLVAGAGSRCGPMLGEARVSTGLRAGPGAWSGRASSRLDGRSSMAMRALHVSYPGLAGDGGCALHGCGVESAGCMYVNVLAGKESGQQLEGTAPSLC